MSDQASSERELDHPLFRVLVLMGGSLALGCGGSAVIDGSPSGSGGTKVVGSAGQSAGGAAAGGAGQGGGAATAGSIPVISIGGTGAGGSGEVDAGPPPCPFAQWDCSGLGQVCEPNLGAGGLPAGCACDLKRPKSVADCNANEDLICRRAYSTEPDPSTWDTSFHIQCACVPGPSVPSYDMCGTACSKAYPMLSPNAASCSLPPSTTCDPYGNNCTATAANVLRQDGIVCGCASVILK
jgi:hypothetical protein